MSIRYVARLAAFGASQLCAVSAFSQDIAYPRGADGMPTSQAPGLTARGTPDRGPISVNVALLREGPDDVLSIRLSNTSAHVVEIDLRESPCSSTELATMAFVGKGAVGVPRERIGIVEYVLPVKKVIEPGSTHTCTFSISRWYDGRWKPADRPDVKIFWAFEPPEDGVFDKKLYGGVVKLP